MSAIVSLDLPLQEIRKDNAVHASLSQIHLSKNTGPKNPDRQPAKPNPPFLVKTDLKSSENRDTDTTIRWAASAVGGV